MISAVNVRTLSPSDITSSRTDSDIGKAGEEEIKDTEGARKLSGNFRLVMWSSPPMRKEGHIPKHDFLEILSEFKDEILDYMEEGNFVTSYS